MDEPQSIYMCQTGTVSDMYAREGISDRVCQTG